MMTLHSTACIWTYPILFGVLNGDCQNLVHEWSFARRLLRACKKIPSKQGKSLVICSSLPGAVPGLCACAPPRCSKSEWVSFRSSSILPTVIQNYVSKYKLPLWLCNHLRNRKYFLFAVIGLCFTLNSLVFRQLKPLWLYNILKSLKLSKNY